jgi:hypothetical protein
MKVGEDWKLIDLDAAAKIGEKAGLKSSTGYVPPELLILLSTGEVKVRDPTQANALTADPSFDMWSFGVLLYLLITGQTLFNNNQEDNLDDQDLIRLCNWTDGDLQAALRKVHSPRGGKYQPLGRDLLENLLRPDASKRPKTMDEVLDHPFFVGESAEELEKENEKLQIQLERAKEKGETAESVQRLTEEIARSNGVITELKATTERVEKGVEENSKKLDQIKEKLCGLKQMGLDQIEGKHKCPSAMLLVRAEDEIPSVWKDVWGMIETEEEARLTELEGQRKELQAQAAELVENAALVIPHKKARGRGFFFAHESTGNTSAAAIDTVETINRLVTNTTEVTLGFVGWVKGMGGVFESIYTRARALKDKDKVAIEKVAELVKLGIIVTKDIGSFLKDLRQWYRFVNRALQQWKKSATNAKQPLTNGAKKSLEDLRHIRTQTQDNIKKKLQQALEWDVCNNDELVGMCQIVINTFTTEEPTLDDEGVEGVDGGGEGCEGADTDGDAEVGDGGRDFMSDMKSYCFRKFGKVAEDKLNKRAKIYDRVQIYLLCEYGGCHVPKGMLALYH